MYKGTLLTDTISIHEVFTIHYFEYMSDFSFAGESHNFWEFVFVDKGEIDIYMESIHARLKKGRSPFTNQMNFTDYRRPEALLRTLLLFPLNVMMP